MSREQDLLFCKIAVANGLVSEDQAKKVIAMANQRESETGRRPLVGAIFSKYNLISQPDVQALYKAVQKRLGGTIKMPGTVPTTGRGAAKRARGGGSGRRRFEKRPTRVDPKTLWMGIGFGIVFVGIIVGMTIFWMVSPGSDKESETAKNASKATSTSSASSGAPTSGTSSPSAEEEAAAETAAEVQKQEMQPEQEGVLRNLLADTQRLLIEDQPEVAVTQLEDALKKIEERKIFVYPALLADLKTTLETAKARVAGDAGGGTEGGALPIDDLGDL